MNESTPILHLFIAYATVVAKKKETSDPILNKMYLEIEIGEWYTYEQVDEKELAPEVAEV